jgi:hypothetical protein
MNVPVYEIPAGHGRYNVIRWGGKYTLLLSYSEIEGVPGSDGNKRDHDKETPVFGITLTDPRSARAYANVFSKLAEGMEADGREEEKRLSGAGGMGGEEKP